MASAEIENYRQLQQDYERERAEYEQAEEAYRKVEASKSEEAFQLFDELKAKRSNLDSLYGKLKNARSELAQLRETASRKVLL
jgi:DNA repair exonuclease SbcCD ATPase subunit